MTTISKEVKMRFLANLIWNQLSIASDVNNENEPDFWEDIESDYQVTKAILADYSEEEASKFSDDFLDEVNQYIEDGNKLVEEGKL